MLTPYWSSIFVVQSLYWLMMDNVGLKCYQQEIKKVGHQAKRLAPG